MTKCLELYKCKVCSNLVEVVLSGEGELVCCGQPMELLQPQTVESETGEKHIPVFNTADNKTEIRVGANLHPMTEEHYIQFIETISTDNKKLERHYYQPDDTPVMCLDDASTVDKARAFCNIHGLWEGKNNL